MQGLKRRAALVPGPLELVTPFLDNTWVFYPLFPMPSLLPQLSNIFGVSHPNWVEKLICDVAYQAPLSMGFPRQEYWSGLSCPPP